MKKDYPLFINGEFKHSVNKRPVINPGNAQPIAQVSLANEEDAEQALESARVAFDQGPWPGLPPEERKAIILKVSEGILDKAQELATLESLNTGKPIKETTFMDIPSSAKTFEYFGHNFPEYLKEPLPQISTDNEPWLLRQPQGVVVLIVPWNYPLLIASWKLAQALCAGNTVVLKPSSLTPLSAMELAGIIQDAGLPKGAVNILNGDGEKLGRILCSDKRADMISFTGSNEVGQKILGYAAGGIKKMIMELGGKSASIILKDADLETAVRSSLCSIFLNQGQMCTAMSRILVEDDLYDRFINEFAEKTKKIKLGDALDYQTQMGPLISAGHREKVIAYVEKAKKEGARLLCGGKIPGEPALKDGFFFEPTVFLEVTPQMAIFNEEVFGPVVCIQKFSSPDEAVELANRSNFALAACIWTKDTFLAKELAAKINAGTIWINTYGMFFNELPYGGFKQSGFGKELGKQGFQEYTLLKNIIIDKSPDSKPLVSHWYGF